MSKDRQMKSEPAAVERRVYLLLFVVIAFMFWGGRTLWESSEARYGEAAREMMELGEWLVPHLGGEPHLTKPPLAYWAMIGGMKVFGVNAWGARFFASLAFLGAILCTVSIARTFDFTERTSNQAGLIYATMVLPFACGHTLTTDVFLVFLETLGVLAAVRVWWGRGNSHAWRWVFWLAFGLAFLTKGPPGWLPLLPLLVWYLIEGRRRETGRLLAPLPILAFMLVSFSWYGAVVAQDSSRLSYFLKDEIVARVASDKFERAKPVYFYLLVVSVGTAPWVFLWPGVIRRAWEACASRFASQRGWQLFLLLWVTLPFIVFTLSKSKMPLYLAPLMPAFALAFAYHFSQKWQHRFFMPTGQPRRWAIAAGAVLLVAMGIFTLLPDSAPIANSRRDFAHELKEWVEGSDTTRPIYMVMGADEYSVLFYSQMIIHQRSDIAVEEFYPFAQGKRGEGENPIYIARPRRIKKLTNDSSRIAILFQTEELAAFELVH